MLTIFLIFFLVFVEKYDEVQQKKNYKKIDFVKKMLTGCLNAAYEN